MYGVYTGLQRGRGDIEDLRKYQHLFSDSSALFNLQTTHTIQVKKTDDDDA